MAENATKGDETTTSAKEAAKAATEPTRRAVATWPKLCSFVTEETTDKYQILKDTIRIRNMIVNEGRQIPN